jgi:hypothetical protein
VQRPPKSGLAALELEIAREMVSSLARVAERLETALAALPGLAAEVLRASPDERSACVAAYNAMRARAAEAYYFMTVQREAMNLNNHDELARHYRIPPPLR